MKSRRLEEIKNYVIKKDSVSFEELCAHFDVSLSTMRRDVEDLVKEGSIQKVYGGIRAIENGWNTSLVEFDPIRDSIGKKASEMIQDGDVILLGSGTTVAHMAPYLKDKKVTVITNNLMVLLNATRYGFKVISIGGTLDTSTVSFVGTQSVKQILDFNADIAFIGCNGINGQCISNVNDMEAEIKKAMIKASNKTVVLIDSNKFNKTSLYNCAQLEEIDAVITDQLKDTKMKEILKDKSVELIESE